MIMLRVWIKDLHIHEEVKIAIKLGDYSKTNAQLPPEIKTE